MDVICGGFIGFLLGYFVCMALASMEMQLADRREEKASEFYKKIVEEQQISITKQNQLIAQLVEDKVKLAIRQQQLSDKLSKLRKQHERTLSALN